MCSRLARPARNRFLSGLGTLAIAFFLEAPLHAQFAYVANHDSNTISGYMINTATGAFSAVTGSPFASGSDPHSIAVALGFAYVANFGDNNVSVYTINSATGALTAVAGSPFASGEGPYALAVDPIGRFLYVANDFDGTVSGYTINPATGALTPIPGSPFTAGSAPISVAVDQSGKFVCVANSAGNTVSVYTIAPGSGVLAPVTRRVIRARDVGESVEFAPLSLVKGSSFSQIVLTQIACEAEAWVLQ